MQQSQLAEAAAMCTQASRLPLSWLSECQVDKLEAAWTELDRLWAQIRYWIQLVHDIEYGYGDPLRCKVRRTVTHTSASHHLHFSTCSCCLTAT